MVTHDHYSWMINDNNSEHAYITTRVSVVDICIVLLAIPKIKEKKYYVHDPFSPLLYPKKRKTVNRCLDS